MFIRINGFKIKCGKSLLKRLILLFKNSTKSSYYPDIWTSPNIILAHKKNDK